MGSEGHPIPRGVRVLAVDIDPDLQGLLDEWLAGRGATFTTVAPDEVRSTDEPFDLVVVDVHCPRLHGTESLKRIGREHPGVPVLAVSSHFFHGIEPSGAVARALRVGAVLSKPVDRDVLLGAVDGMLTRA